MGSALSDNCLINRELSWLVFNERVMQEAEDASVPIVQRLRFLGIFSNNQDEFIKVRLSRLVALARVRGVRGKHAAKVQAAAEILPKLYERMARSQVRFEAAYNKVLSEMAEAGVRIVGEKDINEEQRRFCMDYFASVVSERTLPILIRKSGNLPFVKDGAVYLGVRMADADGKHVRFAMIEIPVSERCPRFVRLPSSQGADFIYLDDIIRICLREIFFMFKYDSISAHSFKVVRDAAIEMDEDISKSLMEKMEEGIESRFRGKPVRLIYDREMPEDLLSILASKLGLDGSLLDAGERYHLRRDLMKFPRVRNDLETKLPKEIGHPAFEPFSSIFDVVAKRDVLLHFPYHSFKHVIDFLREASIDPRVESIFITLYRTANHSKIINALIGAAKNGKKVCVVMELLARFDEGQNIEYADLLQRSGVRVIDGVPGLKVHGKLILVERKTRGGHKGYVYIGTGNFNESTAKIYSDFGLLTCRQQIVEDARCVMDNIVSHKPLETRELLVAPFNMRKRFKELVENEIHNAEKGKPAYIKAKFNSLTDPDMIELLCKASCAGVKIQLIVRGACCLQPGVEGVSENISIISIVDIYLEHARLAIFANGGNEKVFIMSADWMTRNLNRRIEVGTPIHDADIRRQLEDVFDIQWRDNVKARSMAIFGSNAYSSGEGEGSVRVRAQLALHDYYKSMALMK